MLKGLSVCGGVGSLCPMITRTLVRCSSSSTSAMAYKQLHRSWKRPPLPTLEQPAYDANTAVNSILYDTPPPSRQPKTTHVLNCLVQNEPGVLSKISGTLAARGFNIDSLVVCNTQVKDLSRMTIVLQGQDSVIEQARRQIEDMVPVYAVLNYTNYKLVRRELMLARISLLGAEYFQDMLLHHEQTTPDTQEAIKSLRKEKYHPKNLAPSQIQRLKHEHLNYIDNLVKNFRGRIVDIGDTSCIVELSAKPSRITAFLNLVEPFGVLECTRSGMTALPRTQITSAFENMEEKAETEEDAEEQEEEAIEEMVDVSRLPPS